MLFAMVLARHPAFLFLAVYSIDNTTFYMSAVNHSNVHLLIVKTKADISENVLNPIVY
jgi:hypothetical protein